MLVTAIFKPCAVLLRQGHLLHVFLSEINNLSNVPVMFLLTCVVEDIVIIAALCTLALKDFFP